MAGRPSVPDVGQSIPLVIPALIRDPVGALRPWPITVTIGDHEIVVPALPAADWLSVLMAESINLEDVFPGLAGAEDLVDDALFDGVIGLDELYQLGRDVVAVASARPWYVAIRLSQFAYHSWHYLGGDMVLAGVDADRVSFAAWLDALHHVTLQNMDPKNITMFHSQLELPPPEERAEVMEQLEMDRGQFMGMMSD